MYNKLIVKYGCNLVFRRNEDYSDPSNPSGIDRERRGRGNITFIHYNAHKKCSMFSYIVRFRLLTYRLRECRE